MTNGETIPADTSGTQTNPPMENLSEFDKLKVSNDAMEKELVRGRELKAEGQKLEAEKMLGGDSGGHVDAKFISPEDKKTNNAKEFFKDTALGDAISKANE